MYNEKKLYLYSGNDVFMLSPSVDDSGICVSVLQGEIFRCFCAIIDDGKDFSLMKKRSDNAYDIIELKTGDPIPVEEYKISFQDKRAFQITTEHGNRLAVFRMKFIPENLMPPYEACVAIVKDGFLLPLAVFDCLDGTLHLKLAKNI